MSTQEHKEAAPRTVRCKIITVSDTRNEETDKSGKLMIDMLTEQGHEVKSYVIVKDEEGPIREEVLKGCEDPGIDVVLTNGGTGIARRDVTIETVQKLFEKEITGFGELFRMLSYQEDIGSAAIMSRAAAGIHSGTAIFATPGQPGLSSLPCRA